MTNRLRAIMSGGVGAAFLLFGATLAHAQTGTVTGRVTGSDAGGGPLEGARITVVGSNAVAYSNREGVYFLRNLPAGTVQVRVVRLGYNQGTQSVTVADGQTVELHFTLTSAPFTLDEIVTTATGDQRKAELGNVVNTIQVAELAETTPIKSMADLLSGRAPGVTILQSAGTTGAGTRVRIRGSNSVSLSNEPLFVVDGIRIESGAASSTLGVGGQSPSRINDINPDEIESIEVVKGPSAAALYGTRAANGVVLITTKRGSAGRPRWQAWTEQVSLQDKNAYPDNFRGLDSAGNRCRLDDVARGVCSIASIVSFNPMRDTVESPLSNGLRQQYGVSVSGGSEQAQYFVSAEQEWERGVFRMPDAEQTRIRTDAQRDLRDEEIHPNSLRKSNIRANLSAQVSPKATLQVSSGYVDSRLLLPENDNNVNGILSSALNGNGLGGTNPAVAWGFFRPGETFQTLNQQRIQRLTASTQATYTPLQWLTLRSVVGLDLTHRTDNDLNRFGEGPNFGTNRQGFAMENRRTISQYTVDLGATTIFQLNDDISSKTSAGVQWYKDSFRGNNASSQFLTPGAVTIGSGTVQFASEVTVETITLGSFVEQVFGYKDKLFLTGAVRMDRNSTFGQNFGTQLYPKGALSYLISDEDFFPTGSVLSSLRLRAAYGTSGLQPGSTDALEFFTPVVAAVSPTGDQGSVLLGGFGNDSLKPETSRELELGFDATFLDSRIALEATYYDKRSKDALIAVPIPPTAGAPNAQFQNLGAVRNQGIEVTLNTQVFTGSNFSWDATLTGSFLKNRLTDLGGQAPINLNGTDQRAVEGYVLGGYWARSIKGWSDANGDGVISGTEVQITDTLEFQGASQPTRELGLNTSMGFLSGRVRVAAQLDYRGGHKLYNLNEEFRCRSQFNCIGMYDANASEFERVRAVAVAFAPAAVRTNAGYFEDAEFLKLREVSVTLQAPDAWTQRLGLGRASLTVAGRNLHTWTGYSGLDPELNGQGQGNFAQREFLTQPPTRNFSARLNVNF